MRHPELLSANRCVLLVVDIQEAFAKSIADFDRVVARSKIMIQAAQLLDIPIVVSEQYPKGLGHTVEPLRDVLGDGAYHEKVTFGCFQDAGIRRAIEQTSRSQLLLVGIETHVCISQTAYDAIALGMIPYLPVDALASRREQDAEVARQRLQSVGAICTTTEAAIMELTVTAKHPAFKQIAQLIK